MHEFMMPTWGDERFWHRHRRVHVSACRVDNAAVLFFGSGTAVVEIAVLVASFWESQMDSFLS
jgi:hypothetical protein